MFDKIENVKSYLKSNELMRLFNETKAQSIANVSELSIRFIQKAQKNQLLFIYIRNSVKTQEDPVIPVLKMIWRTLSKFNSIILKN